MTRKTLKCGRKPFAKKRENQILLVCTKHTIIQNMDISMCIL